jgi:hypothetical protein
VSCLLGEGRSTLPPLSEAMWDSSVEYPVLARDGDGGPPRVVSMTATSEPSPMGERLKPPNRSEMKSRLPKRLVSRREKISHERRSPSTTTVSFVDVTIGTSRGKAWCKSSFLVRQLSVFFAPARCRVVKIVHSYSKMVLRTTKQTKIYLGSGLSLKIIVLRSVV